MRTAKAGLAGAVLALGVPGAVQATPPSIIAIEDQAFGLSEDELFVLRTTSDNLGSHFESRHETFLVAISLTTGAETYWHVNSVHLTTEFGAEGANDRMVMVPVKTRDRADAFAILSQRGGLPWGAAIVDEGDFAKPRLATSPQSVSLSYGDGARFDLAKREAFQRVLTAMESVPAQIPDYSRLETVSTRDQFAARIVEQKTCRHKVADGAMLPLTYKRLQLFRVTCSDAEDFDRTSVLVPVFQNDPAGLP